MAGGPIRRTPDLERLKTRPMTQFAQKTKLRWVVPQTKLSTPNKITILRIFLAPALVIIFLSPTLWSAHLAALLIALGSLSDWLDGHLARRWSAETDLGRLLDPLADKLLLIAALVPLVALDRVPVWMAAILIGRDMAVTGMRAVSAKRGLVISSSRVGKHKTGLQVIAVILLILDYHWVGPSFWVLGMILLSVSLVLSLLSGFDYSRQVWRQVEPR